MKLSSDRRASPNACNRVNSAKCTQEPGGSVKPGDGLSLTPKNSERREPEEIPPQGISSDALIIPLIHRHGLVLYFIDPRKDERQSSPRQDLNSDQKEPKASIIRSNDSANSPPNECIVYRKTILCCLKHIENPEHSDVNKTKNISCSKNSIE